MHAARRQPRLHVQLKAHTPREKMVITGSEQELGWWDPSQAAQSAIRAERLKPKDREPRLPAAHWRRRFHETQKELFALQREAALMEKQFEEEERQAALEEAALRLQLAKVRGTVDALRKAQEAERAEAAERAERLEQQKLEQQRLEQRRASNHYNEPVPLTSRRGIMTPISTSSSTNQVRQSAITQAGHEFQRGRRVSAPSLLGPVASTPKCSSPGFGSTTASSKVSVIQETGYVPQEMLYRPFKAGPPQQ
mmetsp:Transcript_64674/g.152021  ORF Transcript_64674/g.152021 Transcript_64674/m.152021 type:complete len:252 (+) Transcript_64674:69-824(+)